MPFACSPTRSQPKYGEGDLFRQDDGRVHFEGAASGQDAGDEADGGEGDDAHDTEPAGAGIGMRPPRNSA